MFFTLTQRPSGKIAFNASKIEAVMFQKKSWLQVVNTNAFFIELFCYKAEC